MDTPLPPVTPSEPLKLHVFWRAVLSIIGLKMLVLSFLIVIMPPTSMTQSNSPDGIPRITTGPVDPTIYSATLVVAGAALLAFAANGLKLHRGRNSNPR